MCVQHTEYILEQRRCKNNATIVKKIPRRNNLKLNNVQYCWFETSYYKLQNFCSSMSAV